MSKYSRKVPADAHNAAISKMFKSGLTDKQMAKKLNVTMTYIQNARRSMRLLRTRGATPHAWTDEQDNYLIQSYGVVPIADIAFYLKLSPSVIRDRLYSLNLGSGNWDAVDDAYITEIIRETAEKLEKTTVQVANRAIFLERVSSKSKR